MSKKYAIAIKDIWPVTTGDHVEVVGKSNVRKLDDDEVLDFTEQEFKEIFISCPNDTREARNHIIKDFPEIVEQDLREHIPLLHPSSQRHFQSGTTFDKKKNMLLAENGLALFWSTEEIKLGATLRYLKGKKA